MALLATYGVGTVAWALLFEPGAGLGAFFAGLPDAAWHAVVWFVLGGVVAFVYRGAGAMWGWALR
jgi:hypothetical protein